MDDLFQQALTDSAAEQSLNNILCTNFPLYHTSLQSQNVLSFIYLRNMTNYLVKTNIAVVQYITSHHTLLTDLLYTSNDKNFEILLSFYETLSTSDSLWPSFFLDISQHLERSFHRSLRIYATAFKRYEVLKATSKLHKEISNNIDILQGPIFGNLLNPNHFHYVRHVGEVLHIFYFLIFQDIHPFFEENMDKFFIYFNGIFDEFPETLCKIFSLCIAKYSDCVDIYKILRLCLEKEGTDAVIVQIIKKKEFLKLKDYYSDIAMHVLQKRNSAKELLNDPLRYTRNALMGVGKDEVLAALNNEEFKRVLLIKIPVHCKKSLGMPVSGLSPSTSPDSLELERLFDIFLALKIPIHPQMLSLRYNTSPEGQLLLFTTIRYLLGMELTICLNSSFAETHPNCAYILMHYLTVNADISEENVKLAMSYLRDEYSTKLLFTIVRKSLRLESPLGERALGIEQTLHKMHKKNEIEKNQEFSIDHEEIVDGILRFIYANKEIVNVTPYFYLFDTLGLLASNTNHVKLLRLSNHVLTGGIEELFHLSFYLLSLLVKFNFDTSGLLSVIHNKDLWQEETLIFPLCCLTVSISSRDCTFINNLLSYLIPNRKKAAYFLVARTECPLPDISDIEENFVVRVHRKMNVDLSYFTNNYISTKNVRKVVKAMCLLGLSEDDIVKKNLMNYKDDTNVPFSVCEEFGV